MRTLSLPAYKQPLSWKNGSDNVLVVIVMDNRKIANKQHLYKYNLEINDCSGGRHSSLCELRRTQLTDELN
jgi:hypothetical protein